ncbi:HNH endonuclease signature motif containing protein [Rhodococcus sp. ABRD24]|uniref:HNH endonuclease signature motif containing protein n=1 Tax=Rhodococcus sp. ABRD24 TaxID=2507582 RepID=UPI001F600D05|nr:HNH endonuclease signature motif containing protein [Rhodococcus sp. ABRD24]
MHCPRRWRTSPTTNSKTSNASCSTARPRSNTSRLKDRARRLIARLDPDGTRERRLRAAGDRDVRVIAGDNATSHLEGLLPAEGGRILAGRLRAMTFDVCAHDPRTQAQRRADALVALAAGHTHLDCRCARPDCTARTSTPTTSAPAASTQTTSAPATGGRGVGVQVLVGVDASTLLGFDDNPGYLSGYGAIDADLARELAADATWKQVLTLSAGDRARLTADLPTGPVLGIGHPLPAPECSPRSVAARTRAHRQERTYRPAAALADIVRTRDGGCRFPNCAAPATDCDLDHTVPFDHDNPDRGGLTTESNLACLCRTHHRLKTLGYWAVRHIGEGHLEWIDPTGRATVTQPHGPFCDPAMPPGLTAGLDDELLARLTDTRTLTRLNYSSAELDLDYLLDSLIPARHRHRTTPTPPTPPPPRIIDFDEPPPF